MCKIDKRLTFPLLSTLISLLNFLFSLRIPQSHNVPLVPTNSKRQQERERGRDTNRRQSVAKNAQPRRGVVTMNTLSGWLCVMRMTKFSHANNKIFQI